MRSTLAVFGLLRSPGPAYPVVFLLGLFYFVTVTSLATVLQKRLDDSVRGRVMALWVMAFGGTVPLGAIVAGPLSERFSISAVVLAGAVVAAGTGLLRQSPRPLTGSGAGCAVVCLADEFSAGPVRPRTGLRGMVNAADQLASIAGVGALEQGGTAADAAVAAAAVMAVTSPHLCGMGGDLLAMVSAPGSDPVALLAVGRAGSGVDPARMRAEGHSVMPLRGDVRSVTVPGAVDGWLALHDRFGRLPLGTVLGPAIELAEEGFVASILLALSSHLVFRGARRRAALPRRAAPDPGTGSGFPGIARTLRGHRGRRPRCALPG